MHRLYCRFTDALSKRVIISDRHEVHHIKDVLRLKAKDKVVVFNGQGAEYNCLIVEVSDKVTLSIQDRRLLPDRKEAIRICVACAIPKKSKMDSIVDQLTQLGVARIVPLLTERVIVKLDKDKEASRVKRWKRVALSAAKQSQRSRLPIIEPIKGIREFLAEDKGTLGLRLIPTLIGCKHKSLKEAMGTSCPKAVSVLIGPEGDFSPAEFDFALKAGYVPVSLGDLTLRVETAAVAAVSFIRLYLDEDH